MEKIDGIHHCRVCKGPMRNTVPANLSSEDFCSGKCRAEVIYKNTVTGRTFSGSTLPHTKSNCDDQKT